MPNKKTATLNLRIAPGLKEALQIAANGDHRSIANMVEVLIKRHCESVGIAIPEQTELFPDDQHA
jgi:hypothetical protein